MNRLLEIHRRVARIEVFFSGWRNAICELPGKSEKIFYFLQEAQQRGATHNLAKQVIIEVLIARVGLAARKAAGWGSTGSLAGGPGHGRPPIVGAADSPSGTSQSGNTAQNGLDGAGLRAALPTFSSGVDEGGGGGEGPAGR